MVGAGSARARNRGTLPGVAPWACRKPRAAHRCAMTPGAHRDLRPNVIRRRCHPRVSTFLTRVVSCAVPTQRRTASASLRRREGSERVLSLVATTAAPDDARDRVHSQPCLGAGSPTSCSGSRLQACSLAPVTIGLLIYTACGARSPEGASQPRALRSLSRCSGVFFSAPMWRLAITGRGTDGTLYSAWSDPGFASLVLIEGVVLVLAVAGFVRDLRRGATP